jgi:uncharacterized damage-inducible protein DinB
METIQIAELIDRVMTGDPWHGPSVQTILTGISAEAAAKDPPSGAHTIWDIVLHMTGWAREVTARIGGRAAQEPHEGDWPVTGVVDEVRWRAAQDALFEAHRDLAAAVRKLDANVLQRPVLDYRNSALGTGLSHNLTLHGIVHHTVYHAGQIAILKRVLGVY